MLSTRSNHPLTMLTLREILALSFIPRVGKALLSRLMTQDARTLAEISNFNEAIEALRAIDKARIESLELSEDILRHLHERADGVLAEAEAHDIRILSVFDPRYPQRLRALSNAPVIIYTRGDTNCLNADLSIAIVGTRNPTNFGERCAWRLGALIGGAEAAVVSGLAIGCDAAAHEGCISVDGKTIAVLAHGLTRVYPKRNQLLADAILDGRGCLVSEYPPLSPPFRGHFIERNKIQVALSDGVIVIETDTIGGTMHTVRFCLEQKKTLGCIKHSTKYADRPQTRGNQLLLSSKQALPIYDEVTLKQFWEKVRARRSPDSIATFPIDIAQLCFENGV
jgi:DNA processing protein